MWLRELLFKYSKSGFLGETREGSERRSKEMSLSVSVEEVTRRVGIERIFINGLRLGPSERCLDNSKFRAISRNAIIRIVEIRLTCIQANRGEPSGPTKSVRQLCGVFQVSRMIILIIASCGMKLTIIISCT